MKRSLLGALALAGALMTIPATAQTVSADLFTQKTGPWQVAPPPFVPDGVIIIPALGESGKVFKTDNVPILDKSQSMDSATAHGLAKDMDFVTDDGKVVTGLQIAAAWDAALADLSMCGPQTQ